MTKPIRVDVIPKKRSVKFFWKYDSDPEDTGFRFTINEAPRGTLGIIDREYQVKDLGMYVYMYGGYG